jgi:SanA protein
MKNMAIFSPTTIRFATKSLRILGKYRRWAAAFLVCGILMAGLVGWTYYEVGASATSSMYVSLQRCPTNDIGILFGCGKYVVGGRKNLYYLYRIQAAVELYQAGKVKHILISGDNHIINYNEPETMKQDLLKAGIPETDITLD